MLNQFSSKQLPGLPSIEFIRDLEAYEGPILTEYQSTKGSKRYLEKWCSYHNGITRTLLVRTEQRALAEYLDERISMLDLLSGPSDGIGFLVDRRGDTVVDVFLVTLADLPPKYLPKATAMHDRSLRPDWDTIPHSFLVGKDWDAQKVAVAERRYREVYGFCYFTQPSKKRSLPAGVLHYQYDGGFPIVHAYNQVRSTVPSNFGSKSVGVAAGSPGVLTIASPTEIAEHLEAALRASTTCEKSYLNVYAWSRFKPKKANEVRPHAAVPQLQKLCNDLLVDCDVLLPKEQIEDAKSVLYAGKLVAAYYRRLCKLLEPSEDVEFIGVRVDRPTQRQGISLDTDDDE